MVNIDGFISAVLKTSKSASSSIYPDFLRWHRDFLINIGRQWTTVGQQIWLSEFYGY